MMSKRKIRAVLPNGLEVTIDSDDNPATNDKLNAQFRDLLTSSSSKENDLRDFLINTFSTVFECSDPTVKPVIFDGPNEVGVDFAFKMKGENSFVGVHLKSNRVLNMHLKSDLVARAKSFKKHLPMAKVMYLIAGNELIEPKVNLGDLQQNFEFKTFSWAKLFLNLKERKKVNESQVVVLFHIVDFSRKIIRELIRDPGVLSGIDDRKFEELIATLLYDIGLEDVKITENSAESRDIEITFTNPSTGNREIYFIECKHWVSGNTINASWVVKLQDVVNRENARGGILLSSSGFGPKLVEQKVSFEKSRIYLRDGHDISNWLSIWERRYGSLIFEPISPIDILGISA